MKGLDLRKFRKLHSNADTTTLSHPDGHQIRIAHNKLKPEHQKALADLPKFAGGGVVDAVVKTVKDSFTEKPKPKPADNAPSNPTSEQSNDMSKTFGKTKPKFAYGTPDEPVQPNIPTALSDKRIDMPSLGLGDVNSMNSMGFENLKTEPTPQEKAASFLHKDSDNLSGLATGDAEMQQAGAMAPPTAAAAQAEQAPTNANLAQTPERTPQSTMQQGSMGNMNMPGQDQQIQGIQQEANATGAMGKEEANIANEHAAKAQQLMSDFQQHTAGITQEIQNITHDLMNGHIDPNHFWNSKSELGKAGTAIGLILGGIGGAATGQENPALKFLNSSIDRDIDAQKAQMNNKNSLLGHLNAQFGNEKDATMMAKAMYADVYASKIAAAAAKSKDPIAQARAQQAIGQIKAASAPLIQQVALKQTVMGAMNSGRLGPEEAVQHLVPEKHQKAVFDEIGKATNMVQHEKAILGNFDKASKDNTVIRRTAHGGAEPAELTNVRNLLMPVLKDNEGRINKEEVAMMEDFLPKAGDADSKIAKKRAGLIQFIQSKKAAPTAKGFGIDLSKIPGYAPVSEDIKKNDNAGYGE